MKKARELNPGGDWQARRCSDSARTVFIRFEDGLSDGDILEALSPYGKVTKMEFPFDKERNERKGFGYITFGSKEAIWKIGAVHGPAR